jgi:hypothetical protein
VVFKFLWGFRKAFKKNVEKSIYINQKNTKKTTLSWILTLKTTSKNNFDKKFGFSLKK